MSSSHFIQLTVHFELDLFRECCGSDEIGRLASVACIVVCGLHSEDEFVLSPSIAADVGEVELLVVLVPVHLCQRVATARRTL